MYEIVGDLFSCEKADAICITTNGYVNKQGALTMGKGCAGEAKYRWPGIQILAGGMVESNGNKVFLLTDTKDGKISLPARLGWPYVEVPYHILTFPTKHHWKDPSSLDLITQSCQQLVELTDAHGFESVVIPRPGCGLGQLSWDEVRPICQDILYDERFWIITFESARPETEKEN